MVSLSKIEGDKLQCLLCPHYCTLAKGKTGICGVRKNTGNDIELITYGTISAISTDPIEKKPLYHFYPGYNIYSIGSYGCNMRCDFCQNYHISQNVPNNHISKVAPEKLINEALGIEKNIGIAFTYNEPMIWFEYIRDTALLAKKAGLKTVMVSNGFVNKEPLDDILSFIDAFNIDLKAFNNVFYKKLTGSEIEPVKAGLKQITLSGNHLEVTTLIIPGQNDSEKEMELQVEWMAGELGRDVPFHLSRYHPMYKREDKATPENSLSKLFEIASKKLNYVYLGNTPSFTGQDTYCPACGAIVTKRSGFKVNLLNLDEKGSCTECGSVVYRHFYL
jgi:pyruvate formate lyase activating enzyme